MKKLKLTNLAKDELKKAQMKNVKGGSRVGDCIHQCRMASFTFSYGWKAHAPLSAVN